MLRQFSLRSLSWTCGWLLYVLFVSTGFGSEHEFRVRFSETIRSAPYSGRVYLFFSKDKLQEPRVGPNWFRPEPLLAIDVENWRPDEPLKFGASSGNQLLAMPKPLAELDLTGYRVQAVARFNLYERRVGTGPGNGF